MDSSATSKRKLLPFVPDVPYHIQIVFSLTFGYIWYTAFIDKDYNEVPSPKDEHEITRANWWRAITTVVLFMCSYSYLTPY